MARSSLLLLPTLVAAAALASPNPPLGLNGSPIWHPSNASAQYVLFRSNVFSAPSFNNATMLISARPSPSDSRGTLQSKLFFGFKLTVNGILVSGGPGHSVPEQSQAISSVDITPFVRSGSADNVVAVACFWYLAASNGDDAPRFVAELLLDGAPSSLMTPTGPSWLSKDATAAMNPAGNVDGSSWYKMPDEDLDRRAYPVGWDLPSFVPDSSWVAAAVQPPFQYPLYLEPAPAPAALSRKACKVWQVNGQNTCGQTAEQGSVRLVCSSGPSPPGGPTPAVISAVTFASYGTPTGSCASGGGSGGFAYNASCNANTTLKLVQEACLGQQSCVIPADNAYFGGDPCHKVPKTLAVAVTCSSTDSGQSAYVIDFGQQIMGGVNFSLWSAAQAAPASYPSGSTISVKLGEELNPDTSVMVPGRATMNYSSTWTLAATPADDAITHHEFIQFRYAQVAGLPSGLVPSAGSDFYRAWVVQHPVAATGEEPWSIPCAEETLNARAWGNASAVPAPAQTGSFRSDNADLDAVFNLTAYTAVATSLDINVDSQTRQRDLCHIDALITGLEQYAVFAANDYQVQRRTFLNAFGNDSGIWGSWYEFKASGALMTYHHALETGDLSVARAVWSNSDDSIVADGNNSAYYNSAQFYAGVRYFNTSGSGLLHFPDGCGGSWACDPLADWPTPTRDGYDVNPDNSEDAIRNGIGQTAIAGLAKVAGWLGLTDAAQRYDAMASSITAAMKALLLRFNTSGGANEAYFVDGAVGASANHSAIHSTAYAVAAGAADNDPTLAAQVLSYLRRRDIGPSSCMTARWYVEAVYRLGIQDAAAADFGLQLLSRHDVNVSWGYMIDIGATATLEAWCPGCKWNTDWAHPWCASPAFLIPRWLLGAQPLDLGWRSFRVAPQPSNVSSVAAVVPTPLGTLFIALSSLPGNVTLSLPVPSGATAQACLVPAGSADQLAARRAECITPASCAAPVLLVDGKPVATTAWGRFLCAADQLAPGAHTVTLLG